jgi:hypothetical protein
MDWLTCRLQLLSVYSPRTDADGCRSLMYGDSHWLPHTWALWKLKIPSLVKHAWVKSKQKDVVPKNMCDYTLYYTQWTEFASELHRPSDHRLSAKPVRTFVNRGCHVVSATDPYGRILGFLDWVWLHTHILNFLTCTQFFQRCLQEPLYHKPSLYAITWIWTSVLLNCMLQMSSRWLAESEIAISTLVISVCKCFLPFVMLMRHHSQSDNIAALCWDPGFTSLIREQ